MRSLPALPILTLPILTLALAACGSASEGDKSMDDVVAEAGELAKPLPGQYSSTTTLKEVSIPGMPAEQLEQMKQAMGGAAGQATSTCLTEADAEKGFEDMLRKVGEGQEGLKCTFDQFDAAGNKLDAKMNCEGPGGVVATMVMDGVITTESSDMTMTMTSKPPMMTEGEMKMVMQIASKRTGDCVS